jgi:hypothetical protein
MNGRGRRRLLRCSATRVRMNSWRAGEESKYLEAEAAQPAS